MAKSDLKPANLEITFVENSFDPDPSDDQFESTFVYLIRENGELRVEVDMHLSGIFSLEFWSETLRKTGFTVEMQTPWQDGSDIPLFICLKDPLTSSPD